MNQTITIPNPKAIEVAFWPRLSVASATFAIADAVIRAVRSNPHVHSLLASAIVTGSRHENQLRFRPISPAIVAISAWASWWVLKKRPAQVNWGRGWPTAAESPRVARLRAFDGPMRCGLALPAAVADASWRASVRARVRAALIGCGAETRCGSATLHLRAVCCRLDL